MAKKLKENKIENNEETLSPAFAALIKNTREEIEPLVYGEGETELVVNINVNPTALRRGESMAFAASGVFQSDNESIEGYVPCFRNFAHRLGVLKCFTDLDLSADINDLWVIVNDTTLFDDVVEKIGECEACEFICDLDELIDARVQERIHSLNWHKLLDKIGKYASDIKNSFKDLDLSKFTKGLKNFKGLEGLNLDSIMQSILSKAELN